MDLFRFFRRWRRKEKVDAKRDSAASHPESTGSNLVSVRSPNVRTETESSESRHPISGFGSKARPNRTTSSGWIKAGDSVTVAGRKIGGMIYVGPGPRRESHEWGGSPFINPGLSVAKVGSDITGESLPYWPGYTDINPRARGKLSRLACEWPVGRAIRSWLCFYLLLWT